MCYYFSRLLIGSIIFFIAFYICKSRWNDELYNNSIEITEDMNSEYKIFSGYVSNNKMASYSFGEIGCRFSCKLINVTNKETNELVSNDQVQVYHRDYHWFDNLYSSLPNGTITNQIAEYSIIVLKSKSKTQLTFNIDINHDCDESFVMDGLYILIYYIVTLIITLITITIISCILKRRENKIKNY